MEIMLSPPLRQLMKKSNWFGYLIYSPSLSHLENKWNECKKLEKEFENLRFHEHFYELTKQRLIRDKDNSLDLKSFINSRKLFTKISILHTANKPYNTLHKKRTILHKKSHIKTKTVKQ
jgi:hypothetical protein